MFFPVHRLPFRLGTYFCCCFDGQEFTVLPGSAFSSDRLDVNGHFNTRQDERQRRFSSRIARSVRLFDRPRSWHEQMEIGKAAGTGLSRSQGMVEKARGQDLGDAGADLAPFGRRESVIHQPIEGTPQQVTAVRTMFAATTRAMSGSRICQPVTEREISPRSRQPMRKHRS